MGVQAILADIQAAAQHDDPAQLQFVFGGQKSRLIDQTLEGDGLLHWVLDSQQGVLAAIKSHAAKHGKDHAKQRTPLYSFIQDILEADSDVLQALGSRMVDAIQCAWSLVMVERGSQVVLPLTLFMTLVTAAGSPPAQAAGAGGVRRLGSAELGLRDKATRLQSMYGDKAFRSSGGACGGLLSALCELGALYPEDLLTLDMGGAAGGPTRVLKLSVLVKECEQVLVKHSQGQAVYKTQDYASGALEGLSALLPLIPVESSGSEGEVVFGYLLNNLNKVADAIANSDRTTYNAAKRAMGLICQAGPLGLGPQVVKNAKQLYRSLGEIRLGNNQGAKYAADDALRALLRLVNDHVMAAGPGDPEAARLHEALWSHALDKVSNPGQGDVSKVLLVVVKAIAILMPSTRLLKGEEGVRTSMAALSRLASPGSSDRLYVDVASLYAGPVERAAEMLQALSAGMAQLSVVQPSDVALCMQLVDQLLGVYHEQWARQRSIVHAALLQLLVDAASCSVTAAAAAPSSSSSPKPQPASDRLSHLANQLALVLLARTINSADAEAAVVVGRQLDQLDPPYVVLMPCWEVLLGIQTKLPPTLLSSSVPPEVLASAHSAMTEALVQAITDACRALDLAMVLPSAAGAVGAPSSGTAGAGGGAAGGVMSSLLGSIQEASATQLIAAAQVPAEVDSGEAAGHDDEVQEEDQPPQPYPRSPGDMQAFTSLSEFVCLLFPALPLSLLKPHLQSLVAQLTSFSVDRPTLPGSYHMVAAVMRLADQAHLPALPGPDNTTEGQDTEGGSTQDLSVWTTYIQSLLHTCQQLKGEVLAAALEPLLVVRPGLLLRASAGQPGRDPESGYSQAIMPANSNTAPPDLYQAMLPIRLGLSQALTQPEVAHQVITSLERWEKEDLRTLKEALPLFLPLLEAHLQTAPLTSSAGPSGLTSESEALGDITHHMTTHPAISQPAATTTTSAGSPDKQDGAGQAGQQAGAETEALGDEAGGTAVEEEDAALAPSTEEAESYAEAVRNRRDAAARKKAAALKAPPPLLPRLLAWLGRMGPAAAVLLATLPSERMHGDPRRREAGQHLGNIQADIVSDGQGAPGTYDPASLGDAFPPASAVNPASSCDPRPKLQLPLVPAGQLAAVAGSGQPQLPFDVLLLRVSKLASSSADRAVRVAASELLHACVLYLVGNAAQNGAGPADLSSGSQALLAQLLPQVLWLGSSSCGEPVSRQLFGTLGKQLVHWFARSQPQESPELLCLRECLLQGLSHSSDGGLRDHCAALTAELLHWECKHTPAGSTFSPAPQGSLPPPAILLRSLMDRLHHPRPSHRLGAAVAVRTAAPWLMRTQSGQSLAVQYLLPLLRSCMVALQLPAGDQSSLGVPAQLSSACTQLMASCWPKASRELCRDSSQDGAHAFMAWLWQTTHVASPLVEVQQQALALLQAMCASWVAVIKPSQATSQDASDAVRVWLTASAALQGSLHDLDQTLDSQVLHRLTLPCLPIATADTAATRGWHLELRARLKLAGWMLQHRLCTLSHLSSSQPSTSDPATSLLAAVQQFLGCLSGSTSTDATTQPQQTVYAVSSALLDFLTALLPLAIKAGDQVDVGAGVDWQSAGLGALLSLAVLHPVALGAPRTKDKLQKALRSQALNLLTQASAHCTSSHPPATAVQLLTAVQSAAQPLVQHALSDCGLLTAGGAPSPLSTPGLPPAGKVLNTLQGLCALLAIPLPQSLSFLPPSLGSPSSLAEQSLSLARRLSGQSYLRKQAAAVALRFSFQAGLPLSHVLHVVLDEPQGVHLYRTFQPQINRWALFHADQVVPAVFAALTETSVPPATATTAAAASTESRRAAAEELFMGLIGTLRRTSPAAPSQPANTPPQPAGGPSTPVRGQPASAAAAAAPATGTAGGGPAPGKRPFSALPDVHLTGFLRAVRAGLGLFLPLASSTAAAADRALVLRVLKALLTLDTKTLLTPSGAGGLSSPVSSFAQLSSPGSRATARDALSPASLQGLTQSHPVLGLYLSLLMMTGRGPETALHVTETLELLPQLLRAACQLPGDDQGAGVAEALCMAVEKLQDTFPTRTNTLAKTSSEATLLLRKLRAMIQTLEALALMDTDASGQQGGTDSRYVEAAASLLDVLLPTLQELGRCSKYWTPGAEELQTTAEEQEQPRARSAGGTAAEPAPALSGHLWQAQLEERLMLLAVMCWRPAALAEEDEAVKEVLRHRQLRRSLARQSQTQTQSQTGTATATPAGAAPSQLQASQLAGFANSPTVLAAARGGGSGTAAVAERLVQEAWGTIMSAKTDLSKDLRVGLLYGLLLPLLQQAPPSWLISWYQKQLPALYAVVSQPHDAQLGTAIALTHRRAAWVILELMYKRLTKAELDSQVFTGAWSKTNANLMRCLTRDYKELIVKQEEEKLTPGSEEHSMVTLARCARCAAWCAGVALCVGTQSKANIIAKLFEGNSKGVDPAEPWDKLLPLHRHPPTFSVLNKAGFKAGMSLETQLHQLKQAVRAVQHRLGAAGLVSLSLTPTQSTSSLPPSLRSSLTSISAGLPPTLSQSLVASSMSQAVGGSMAGGVTASLADKLASSRFSAAEGEAVGAEEDTAGQGLAALDLTPEEVAILLSAGPQPDSLPSLEDELDMNPCMLPLVQLIEKLTDLPETVAVSDHSTPDWMDRIRTAVSSADVPRYTRLSLVKALLHIEVRRRDRGGGSSSGGGSISSGTSANPQSPSPAATLSHGAAASTLPTSPLSPSASRPSAGSQQPQAAEAAPLTAGSSSGTLVAKHIEEWFPCIVGVLLDPGAGPPQQQQHPPAPTPTDHPMDGAQQPPAQHTPSTTAAGATHSARPVFHYVLRDLCSVMATCWGRLFDRRSGRLGPELAHPSVQEPAERLVGYLMRAAPHRDNRVLAANIEFIRALLTLWQSMITVPAELFLTLLAPPSTGKSSGSGYGGGPPMHETTCALKLLMVALSNGQAKQILTGPQAGAVFRQLLRPLASPRAKLATRIVFEYGRAVAAFLEQAASLSSRGLDVRDITPQAAQASLTDAIQQMARNARPEVLVRFIQGAVEVAPRKLVNLGQGSNPGQAWPDVAASALNHVLRRFPDLKPAERARALLAFRRRASLLVDKGLLTELRSDSLASLTLLAAAEPVLQVATLSTVRALLYYGSRPRPAAYTPGGAAPSQQAGMDSEREEAGHEDVSVTLTQPPPPKRQKTQGPLSMIDPSAHLKAVEWVCDVALTHPDVQCRRELLSILQDGCAVHPEWADLPSIKCPLAVLLADHDGAVRAAALTYWHTRLPKTLPDRLKALLGLVTLPMPDAWKDKLHKRWPAAAATLIIRCLEDQGLSAGSAPGVAARRLFNQSLGDCAYTDMVVSTDVTGSQSGLLAQRGGPGQVQATLPSLGTSTYRRSSVAVSLSLSVQIDTTSSLGVRASQTQATQPAASQSLSGSGVGSSAETAQLRSRIPTMTVSGYKAGFLRAKRQEESRRQRFTETQRVALLRTYRVGELPDVLSLTASSFLSPLFQVVDRDADLGTRLLGTVVSLITDPGVDASTTQPDSAAAAIAGSITAALATIPNQPHLAGTLLHLAYQAGSHVMGAAPLLVTAAAEVSGDVQSAALQLEARLLQAQQPATAGRQAQQLIPAAGAGAGVLRVALPSPEKPTQQAHRAAGDAGAAVRRSPETAADVWQALAELYGELGDVDVKIVAQDGYLQHDKQDACATEGLMAAGRQARALSRLKELYGKLSQLGAGASRDRLFIREQQLTCMEALGAWQDLGTEMQAQLRSEPAPMMLQDSSNPDLQQALTVLGPPGLRRVLRSSMLSPAGDVWGWASSAAREVQTATALGKQIVSILPADAAAVQLLQTDTALPGPAPTAGVTAGDVAKGVWRSASDSLVRCAEAYRALHPLSTATRLSWLACLQPLAEVHETGSALSMLVHPTTATAPMDIDTAHAGSTQLPLTISDLVHTWVSRVSGDMPERGITSDGDGGWVVGLGGGAAGGSLSGRALAGLSAQGCAYTAGVRAALLRKLLTVETDSVRGSAAAALARCQLHLASSQTAVGAAQTDLAAVLVQSAARELAAVTLQPHQQLPVLLSAVQVYTSQLSTTPADTIALSELKDAIKKLDAADKAGAFTVQGLLDAVRAWAKTTRANALQALAQCAVAGEEQFKWARMTASLDNRMQATELSTTELPDQAKLSGSVRCRTAAQAAASAHLQMALCAHQFCQEGQPVDRKAKALSAKVNEAGGLSVLVVRHMLMAQALDHTHTQWVPLLLQYLDKGDSAIQEAFATSWRTVPPRSWLPWLPQIIARAAPETPGPSTAAVSETLWPLLQFLGQEYPQRVYLPLSLAPSVSGAPTAGSPAVRAPELLQHVRAKSGLLLEFVGALDALTPPLMRWEWYAGTLRRMLAAGQHQAAVSLYRQQVLPNLFNNPHVTETRQSSTSGQRQSRLHQVNLQFSDQFLDVFSAAFGAAGEKLPSSVQHFDRLRQGLFTEGQLRQLRSTPSTVALAHFSPWFERFTEQAAEASGRGMGLGGAHAAQPLLVPLTGDDLLKEDSQLPAIVGFSRTALVFKSKQQPKKIELHMDDFTTRSYIVKGAEDLRVDQRIEQLFDTMNSILRHDPVSCRRGLFLSTYDVVPMTASVGLMEFVPGTVTLKDAVVPLHVTKQAMDTADASYMSYMGGAVPSRYMDNYTNISSKQAESALSTAQSHLPTYALRSALMAAAGSPQAFLANRQHYTRCLSTLSVCGWLCGVGDRHPGNILLVPRTGGLVAIDFGYSFGAATTLLPIPELVPFRMTRQLLSVLAPLNGPEVLVGPMTAALEALQGVGQTGGGDLLSAMFSLFQQEPLTDWMAESHQRGGSRERPDSGEEGGAAVSGQQRVAKAKVDIVLRKLKRASPADTTLTELSATRHAAAAYWPQLQSIVSGSSSGAGHKYRATVARAADGACATTEVQVRCLLDQATDPNILGRTWQGWSPYL